MRISDWSSDVCSSDLRSGQQDAAIGRIGADTRRRRRRCGRQALLACEKDFAVAGDKILGSDIGQRKIARSTCRILGLLFRQFKAALRSEEHTSELQSLMRISYAVFCLKTKTQTDTSNMNKQQSMPLRSSDII